jgi:1-acyl-sn-glycerol-3-phosphate acyltransferase
MLRSTAFFIAYWLITLGFGLLCLLLALLPGGGPLGWGFSAYSRAMLFAMRHVAGIEVEVRGLALLPPDQTVIAAKHQSWGDGFAMLAHVRPLGFVAGDHLERFPCLGALLKKAGAIVLSNNGGDAARARLAEGCARLKAERRSVLIYPEGHLSAPGESAGWRKGVWHLYDALERPCVPVATNLGLAWNQRSFVKRAGRAVVEFLEPIEPGLDKETFMARLVGAVEARTNQLVAEGLK